MKLGSPTTPPRPSNDSRRSLTQRALDAVFGYDFFISYTRRDGGKDYALALARRLEKEGFQVFFDSDDYAMGDDWKVMGKWALHRTSQLVLVASPEALSSSAVVREVEIYSTLRGKRIIPIDFGGTVRHRDETKPVFLHLRPEILFIEEHPDCLLSSTQPSDFVIQKLRDGLHLKRQDKKRARFFSIIAAALLVLALLASAAAVYAQQKREEALAKSREIQRASGVSHFLTAADALRRREDDLALAHLARAGRDDPDNAATRARLITLLGQRRWPVPLRTFKTTTPKMIAPVRSILLHPDGRRLLTESGRWNASSAEVRDWHTGKLLATPWAAQTSSLFGMQFSQDGSTFVAAYELKGNPITTYALVPPLTGSPIQLAVPRHDQDQNPDQEPEPAQDEFDFRALAPSGKFLITSSPDSLTLRARAAATPPQPALSILFGTPQPPAPSPTAPLPAQQPAIVVPLPEIESTDALLAIGCSDQAVFLLGKDGALWKVRLAPTAEQATAPQQLATLLSGQKSPPAHAAFSHRGDRLAVLYLGDSSELHLLGLTTSPTEILATADAFAAAKLLSLESAASDSSAPGTLKFLPNDTAVVLDRGPDETQDPPKQSSLGGWWHVPQADGGTVLQWHALPPDATFGTDSRYAIVQDGSFARIVDTATGAQISAGAHHDDAVTAATLFQDTLLATGTDAGETRLWTLLKPSLLAPPAPEPPTGTGTDAAVPVWAIHADYRIVEDEPGQRSVSLQQNGKTLRSLDLPDWGRTSWDSFESADFSPDGTTLLMTGIYRHKAFAGAALFSCATGRPISEKMEHEGCVWAAYAPGGHELVTAGGRHVQIWNAQTCQPASPQLVHPQASRALWRPQSPRTSRQMLTIAEGNSLRLWDLEKASVIREVPWPDQLRTRASTSAAPPSDTAHPILWAAFSPTGDRFMLLSGPPDPDAPAFLLTLFDAATLEQLSDPVPAPQLPPGTTFAQGLAVFPWHEKIDAAPTPQALELLFTAAEFIAGRQIAASGTIEPFRDVPAALAHLTALAAQTADHPIKALVQQLAASPGLAPLCGPGPAQVTAEEAATKAGFILQEAVDDAEETYAMPGYPGSFWYLDRQRLDDLARAFAQARKLSPHTAESLITGLYATWRQRTDPASLLTRWHFQRAPADHEAARTVFAQEITAALSAPDITGEGKTALLKLQQAWEADLK